jgi:hypothetical protein
VNGIDNEVYAAANQPDTRDFQWLNSDGDSVLQAVHVALLSPIFAVP